MDIEKTGAFIKAQRTVLNMTQKELAEKIGCTDKAVSRWETGKGLPDMSFLIPLSDELKVTVNELLTGEKIEPELHSSEEAQRVAEIIKRNDENLAAVIVESQKTIKRHKGLSLGLFLLLCLQMITFFVIPGLLPVGISPAETMIILTAIISLLAGTSKSYLKWLFPVIIALMFFLINLFFRTEEGFLGFVVSLYFAAGSAVLIAVTSLVCYLFRKLSKVKER